MPVLVDTKGATMAKQKASPHSESPFWHPEKVGDSIEGKFLTFQPTELGMAVQLSTGLVGMGTVLRSRFNSVYTKLRPGDKIRIEYMGTGRRAKLFRLFVNGKEVAGKYGPANKEQLAAFFSPDYVPPKGTAKGKGKK